MGAGENFDVFSYTQADKPMAIEALRGCMAALKLDVWASAPEEYKNEMDAPSFKAEIQERLSKWPNQPLEEFENHIFKPRNICNSREVFEFLNHLQLGKEKFFLAKAQLEYRDLYG